MMEGSLLFLLFLAAQDPGKAALPSEADQAQALKLVKDVFKAEFAKTAPADKKALARKMLDQGRETKDDPPTQYVLFREARELANQAGELPTALEAIEETARRFGVDAGALRTAALAATAKTAKTPEECAAVATAAIKIADGALARDDFDAADKTLVIGLPLAKKAQDAPLTARVTSKSKEALDLRAKFSAVKKARETLATAPEDPAANFLVGHYLCLLKGRWDEGLPYLARGSDETFRTVASAELGNPADPPAQNTLGDGWWDLGEKEIAAKDLLRERAALWYARALPKLGGLNKTKVEKRLAEINGARLAKGDWLNCSDPKNFNKLGKPGDPIEISCRPGYQTFATARQFPKGQFDAISVHLTLDLSAMTRACVYLDGDRIGAMVDCGTGTFGFAKRENPTLPWTPVAPEKCLHPEDCSLTVVLKDGEFILYLENLEKARIKTSATSISVLNINIHFGNATLGNLKLRRAD